MSYYRTCPRCEAHLDPGERCDCQEKTAPSAANTESGKADRSDQTVSASNDTTD